MRRLNVHSAQLDECIQRSLFAISFRPQSQGLYAGEPLLLQLVKDEARKQGKEHARINFALIFDHLERDHDGSISRAHWPAEQRVWDWIVYGSATVPTVPFSLEDLGLSRAYDGQTNPQYIEPADEEKICPYLQWSLAETPQPTLQLVPPRSSRATLARQRCWWRSGIVIGSPGCTLCRRGSSRSSSWCAMSGWPKASKRTTNTAARSVGTASSRPTGWTCRNAPHPVPGARAGQMSAPTWW